VIFFFVAPSCK